MMPTIELTQEAAVRLPWSESEVRRLLRALKRPYLFDGFPLAQALCSALGLSDSGQAVRAIIERTFVESGPGGQRLNELIRRCDIDGDLTETVACELGLSQRQFFRHRSQAIRMISAQIKAVLKKQHHPGDRTGDLASLVQLSNPTAALKIYEITGELGGTQATDLLSARISAGDALEELSDYTADSPLALLRSAKLAYAREIHGASTRSTAIRKDVREKLFYRITTARQDIEFEIAHAEFAGGRHSGYANEMLSTAQRMRLTAAANERLALRASLAEVEAQLTAGRIHCVLDELAVVDHASWKQRDMCSMALALLLRGETAFLQGDREKARDYARIAAIALRELPYELARCEALLGRLQLLGTAGTSCLGECRFANDSWISVQRTAIQARQLIGVGDVRAARNSAEAVRERASARGFSGLAAWNLATLAAINALDGSPELAQSQAKTALVAIGSTNNANLARDLFELPGLSAKQLGPLFMDVTFQAGLTAGNIFAFAVPFELRESFRNRRSRRCDAPIGRFQPSDRERDRAHSMGT